MTRKKTDFVRSRISILKSLVSNSRDASIQSQALFLRIAYKNKFKSIKPPYDFDVLTSPEEVVYGGIPNTAALGFAIGGGVNSFQNAEQSFIESLSRIKQRSNKESLIRLFSDDFAVLGIADGLAWLKRTSSNNWQDLTEWFTSNLDQNKGSGHWTDQARLLAGDLLDRRGRLRVDLVNEDTSTLALEITLRSCWTEQFQDIPIRFSQAELLESLLTDEAPSEFDRAIVWLFALHQQVRLTVAAIIPSSSVEGISYSNLTKKSANMIAFRNLLKASFSDEDFDVFCYDNFPELRDDMSYSISKSKKIQNLLEFCDTRERFEFLANLLAEERPEKYQSYQDQLFT